jgi:Fe-S oxidoreductase
MLEIWGNPYHTEAPQDAEGQGEAAVFVGDEGAYLRPAAVEAAVRLLNAAGVEPVRIGIGRSSGFLASSLGLPEIAEKLARDTLAELETTGAKRLFVLSAGDYFTFHQLYEERLGIPWPEEVEIVEITGYLHEQVAKGSLSFGTPSGMAVYAYVDPTHAVRVPTRHDAPRALLAALGSGEALELFWNRDRGHPAGTTGVRFTTPDVAEKLTRARLQDARDVGAQQVFCEDPATLVELAKYVGEYGLTLHGLYEFLAENLPNDR